MISRQRMNGQRCAITLVPPDGLSGTSVGVDATGLTPSKVVRHTPPRVATPAAPLGQADWTHFPPWRTIPEGQLKHWSEPLEAQVAHPLEHWSHVPATSFQNCPRLQALRQRPEAVLTGLSAGQEVHWSNRGPEQVAQSS